MCGIIGAWVPTAANHEVIDFSGALATLRHRGPDGEGLARIRHGTGDLVLGHARLSIIDLTSAASQPMRTIDGRFTIAFNGEICNYRELRAELRQAGHSFRTESDTEVLLAAWTEWGAKSLSRFSGMFAFAIHDHLRNELVLARDAFGIKPLYHMRGPHGSFVFGSEIPALLRLVPHRSALNYERAGSYLAFGQYDNTESTFFAGVSQLMPGHLLRFSLTESDSAPIVERWWWPSIQERSISFGDAAERVRELFLASVRLQLRSDVPLGAALSGGLDSSAVVCAMRHVEPDMPIHTFSYVARGSRLNEEHWADLINNHVSAVPHKVFVSPSELAGDLSEMLTAQGEPFGSTSIYAQFRVYRLAKECGVTVTLDGQGADELLAGYTGFPRDRISSLLELGRPWDAVLFSHSWSRWPGRTMAQGASALLKECMPDWIRAEFREYLLRKKVPAWLTASPGTYPIPRPSTSEASEGRGRRLVSALRASLTGQGLNALLRHGDRNSMRWSIESRVPFLTIGLAEFLLSLPEQYLISPSGQTKSVFRAAMRDIVPAEVLNRRDKIGFETPEREWLSAISFCVEEWLEGAERIEILNASACRREVMGVVRGERPFTPMAWRLINLCRWAQAQSF